MKYLIVLLFISALVINRAEKAKANQHYSYNVKDDHTEDHHQQRQVTDLEYNENNQANQKAVAQEDIDSFRLYEGIRPHLPPHHQIQPPPLLETQQQNPQKKFTSVHYNVRQNLDDSGEVDIVYHHARGVEGDHEASQQEKPSLLALLKSQQQELSEGYATFLQEEQHESSNDNYQQQRKEEAEEKQQQQQPERQLTNPQLLHYQKLQEQQQLYYQQLQQEEQQQQQKTHLLLQKPSQEIQQQLPQTSHQILCHQNHQQQQQQQRPQPPHAPTYVTPQTTLSPPQRLSPSAPPAIVHQNLHHQLQQQHQQPAIVSHATGNEASPSSPINPQPYQRNRLPHYARDTGVKYATHHKAAYGHPPPVRQPATVYGPPPHLPALGSSKHSKQVIYAPMRFVYDRKLPYSSKTFPYPPSFISLTTTTEKPAHNFYSYDHKSAYNKIPDLFGHRNAKSLLDSYIPSWQVVKMLQQYHQQTSNAQQQPIANLQTLAMPFHRNYKRNVKDQGKP